VTFLTSKYRMAYGRTRCPDADAPDEVVKAVRVIVKEFARRHGFAEGATTAFLKELFSEWALHDQVADMGQKVWTSQKKLEGREFCSIVNELIRTDALFTDEVADQAAILAHAINRNVVTRSVEYDVPWPSGPKGGAGPISTMKDVCFRGGGFCDTAATRDFFGAGRKYRVPGFLATSYNKYIAEHFIQRVRPAARSSTRKTTALLSLLAWTGDLGRGGQRVCALDHRARPGASLQPRQPRHGHARARRVRVPLLCVLGVRSRVCALVAHAS
jgi:hypothetical protein